VGNRLTQENHYDESVYAYDASNRLTDIDGVSYVWDANGNLIQAGNRSLTYDHANRLISLTAGPEAYTIANPAKNMQGERQRLR
jgi:hypothetical protein